MTRILYKQYDLETHVIAPLSKFNTSLKSTLPKSINIGAPRDFEYYSYLNELHSKLSEVLKESVKVEEWLKESVRCFEDASTAIKDDFDTFIPVEIPVDTESINKLY